MVLAQAAKSAFVGFYNIPGGGRNIGRWLGSKTARIMPNVGIVATDKFVHKSSMSGRNNSHSPDFRPTISRAAYYEIDNSGSIPAAIADGHVASGRLAISGVMGASVGMTATACGAHPMTILISLLLGVATELSGDATIGVKEGIMTQRILEQMTRTTDTDEIVNFLKSLLEFMGPVEVLNRIAYIFKYTRDMNVAKNIAHRVVPFVQDYASQQVIAYASGRTGHNIDRFDGRSDHFNQVYNTNPVTQACRKFTERTLGRSVAWWNPRSWARPLSGSKRQLFYHQLF